ncbi:NYN domain-containing protein [Thalassomonas sp. M1454]|uniref:NYN domain-containing protein n=1 Tax=Thalassomonas sp. M1454 TaxID=2594477 RepID=UPI00117C0D0A|nr:NYN domain-containing protein [Thalassomonas sp. M1454]TRX52742.1 NYN domain-containing protein [Thalassomonas sp. M1454]
MTTRKPRVALFIDADNASAKQIKQTLTTLSAYGSITMIKAFGNWKKPHLKSWAKFLKQYKIQPVQQFDVTKQKNATDIALTIDVIDTLHNDNIDVFAIMSSDADFTPVVERLRSAGKVVIGIGERHANQGFMDACSEFVVVGREAVKVAAPKKLPTHLKNTVRLAISTCAKVHGKVRHKDVENLLRKIPSFDKVGCSSQQLAQLINTTGNVN